MSRILLISVVVAAISCGTKAPPLEGDDSPQTMEPARGAPDSGGEAQQQLDAGVQPADAGQQQAPSTDAGSQPTETAASLFSRSPVSPAGYLGQYNLKDARYAIAFRFVLPETVTIDRWYFVINGEGSSCVGGRTGYGAGDGGTWFGRIVKVDPATGLPTQTEIASERVNGCVAWKRTVDEFGAIKTHQRQFVQFPPATLQAGVLYAFVLSNVHASPLTNHMSANLNFANIAEMGPNGRNNLDPTAAGAMYGLDPRETTLWSDDRGVTWKFGEAVGYYDVNEGIGKMWPNDGYRLVGGQNVARGWPFTNWPDEISATLTFKSASADQTLTVAGGSSSEGPVGVVTVKNLTTGQSATTVPLGKGVVRGALSKPITVLKGQSYSVSNSGRVEQGDSNTAAQIFGFGQREPFSGSCSGCAHPTDHPAVYAK